ncbi:MAG: DAK2 domain-containing protein [Clostridia bacterium]|nr:DAK2 domain-containing protein [Clostridia bacterium]
MITGKQFKDAIISAAHNICRQKKSIDALNVFPVPDGDTGTNMAMTISAAIDVLNDMDIDDTTGIDEVSSAIASALLRGARGNSGVILSQLFRGFSNGCKGKKELDSTDFASALASGVDAAYRAVLKPTEGTVLTVSRMAAAAAAEAAKDGLDNVSTIEAAIQQGEKTLAETPEMLPQLKKAGVVDAGGMGYIVILEGILSYLKSGKVIELGEEDVFTDEGVVDPEVMSEDEITFTYCTEFIVDRSTAVKNDTAELREFLSSIGDSVVVVDDDEIIKIHVHTDSVGKAFDEASKYGMLEKIKVENMRVQLRERLKKLAKKAKKEEFTPAAPENEYGMVAVASGEGMMNLFTELGCDKMVMGGQTMNPSTEDILRACNSVPAKNVFVFPNNKNIIMAAEQASALATDRKIIVIPTKTVPQGISAALMFDPTLECNELTETMTDAARNVLTGQITFAARDSDFDGKDIKEGQILAMNEDKLAFVGDDINSAALDLASEIAGENKAEFITLYYGADVAEEKAAALADSISERFTEAEVNIVDGGQPVYSYILSVEC